MLHQEDMELTLCHSLIQIIILLMSQARPLSDHHLLTQRDIQVKYSEQEFQEPNLVESKQSISLNMWPTKQISTDQDKHLKIIVLDMLWIVHYGIAQAGLLKETFTPINREPNIESNSINQNHSTNVRSEKLLVDLTKDCWLMNQETWRSQDSVEIILTFQDSKRTERALTFTPIESTPEHERNEERKIAIRFQSIFCFD